MKNPFPRIRQVRPNIKGTWRKRSQSVKVTVHLVKIHLSKSTCSFLRWRFTALTVDVGFVLARPACLTVIPTAGLDFPWSSSFLYQSTLAFSLNEAVQLSKRTNTLRQLLQTWRRQKNVAIQSCSERAQKICERKKKPSSFSVLQLCKTVRFYLTVSVSILVDANCCLIPTYFLF